MGTRQEMTGSDYFNVEEVKSRGGTVNLTIDSVSEKEFKNQEKGTVQNKFVIKFQNEKKLLTRGKQNINEMFDILPDDTDDWEGERVQLYIAKVELGPKRVDGIRVRRVPAKSAAKSATVKAPIEESTGDAEVDETEDAPY